MRLLMFPLVGWIGRGPHLGRPFFDKSIWTKVVCREIDMRNQSQEVEYRIIIHMLTLAFLVRKSH